MADFLISFSLGGFVGFAATRAVRDFLDSDPISGCFSAAFTCLAFAACVAWVLA